MKEKERRREVRKEGNRNTLEEGKEGTAPSFFPSSGRAELVMEAAALNPH